FQADRRIGVPRVFPEYCSERILTTEFVEGRPFKEFLASASQAEKDACGEVLWDFAFESIFRHGLFNADPHPGNYLFQGERVVFLDFGCVKRFERTFMEKWKTLICAVLEQNRAACREALISLGFFKPGELFHLDFAFDGLSYLYTPWLRDE